MCIFTLMQEPKKLRRIEPLRRPTGMNRCKQQVITRNWTQRDSSWVIFFLCSAPSLIPTDTGCGYRQPKARLGRKHVRPWKWMLFTNSARQVSHNHHWLGGGSLLCSGISTALSCQRLSSDCSTFEVPGLLMVGVWSFGRQTLPHTCR